MDKLIKKMGRLSQAEIERLRAQLETRPVVGIDETGARVNGKRHWHWVFQDPNTTLIVHRASRGAGVIKEMFPDGFGKSIVVHDNFSAYSQLGAQGEQRFQDNSNPIKEHRIMPRYVPSLTQLENRR